MEIEKEVKEEEMEMGRNGHLSIISFFSLIMLILLLVGTASAADPVWTRKPDWDVIGTYYWPVSAFADLDGDGDYDLLIGERDGNSKAFENMGNASIPMWVRKNDWDPPTVSKKAKPAFADLDGDGDYDLLVGQDSISPIPPAIVRAFENTGDASSPTWTAKPEWDAPQVGRHPYPTLADLDGDGDNDMLIGTYNAKEIYGCENTGTVNNPVWTLKPEWDISYYEFCLAPALADFDGDGDYDMLFGGIISGQAAIHGCENTGNVSSPTWTLRSNWDVPIAKPYPSPALADLDGDGDSDLLCGWADSHNDWKGIPYAFKNRAGEVPEELYFISININPNCTEVTDEIFVNESNEICAVLHNDGPDNVSESFEVCLAVDGNLHCVPVTEGLPLPAGENTTVCINWTPDCSYAPASMAVGTPVTVKVIADYYNDVYEVNETNNSLSKDIFVYNNGYKSKNFDCNFPEEPLTLFEYDEMYGGLVYNVSGVSDATFELGESQTRIHHIDIPAGMNVKKARLYVYWHDYHENPSPGYLANLDVSIAGVTHTAPDAAYTDQKGFGTNNTPKGTYVYDVTPQVTGSGDYTVTVKNTGADKTAILGEMLLVVYKDPMMRPDNWMNLWLMEGCDYLMAADNYCVSPEEATATVTFPGTVDTSLLSSAELITVVAEGMEDGANKLFNGVTAKTNAWNASSEAYPGSEINVDVEDVKSFLTASGNTLGFEDTGTDGMQASNAILMVREEAPPNSVYLVPGDSSAFYCSETIVQVYASTTDFFQGGQMNLTYDSNCANVTNVVFNPIWNNPIATWWDTYTGYTKIAFGALTPAEMVNGSVWICNMSIHGVCDSDCSTPLSYVPVTKLVNDTGAEVEARWIGGTFNCMPALCGDVNNDGRINMADVMTLWYDYADYPTPGAYTVSNEWAADVNCDQVINMADVMTLWYDYADYPTPGAYEVECCGS